MQDTFAPNHVIVVRPLGYRKLGDYCHHMARHITYAYKDMWRHIYMAWHEQDVLDVQGALCSCASFPPCKHTSVKY
jgi:hypothetical protein